MMALLLLVAAIAAYKIAFESVHVVDGVQKFTRQGAERAMRLLHTASVAPPSSGPTPPGLPPGAVVVMAVAQLNPLGVAADGAVTAAASRGGVVLATTSVLDVGTPGHAPAFLAVTSDAGVVLASAKPGSPWAVLAPL